MIETNVISLVGQNVAAGLLLVGQNLIHPLTVHVCTDDCGKVLQGDLQRFVHPSHHQQEHKECENIDLAAYQKHTAYNCHSSHAQFQDHLC